MRRYNFAYEFMQIKSLPPLTRGLPFFLTNFFPPLASNFKTFPIFAEIDKTKLSPSKEKQENEGWTLKKQPLTTVKKANNEEER